MLSKAKSPGAGIAQLVERPTDKPGTSDAGSSPKRGKGFFSQSTNFRADSLTVFVQPPCAIACNNICAHNKTTNRGSHIYHGSDVQNIAHTDRNKGISAALAAAVPYTGN